MMTLKHGDLVVKVKNIGESYDYAKKAHVLSIIPEGLSLEDAKKLGEGDYILVDENGVEIAVYHATPERYTRNVQENVYTLTLNIK